MRAPVERAFAIANALTTNGLQVKRMSVSEDRARLQRTKSVGFRVRPSEYEELVQAAEAAGMPIGEWIRDVSLRAARQGDSADCQSALPKLVRIGLEEVAALRAVVLTLFGTTHPTLAKDEIDQMLAYADSVKRERVDLLFGRQA
jgi:hypothetical protein